MIKKVISLAMAICMLAALFVGMNASAATLTGSIATTDNAGNSEDTFFLWDNMWFVLQFSVDSIPTNSEFDIDVVDNGGNVIAWKTNVHTNNPADGQHQSWVGAGSFWLNGWDYGPGLYWIQATLNSNGQLLYTDSFTILQEGVVIQPDDRTVFAPGENIGIDVTVDHPDGDDGDINVTLGGVDGGLNVSWLNQALSGYKWSVQLTIPADTKSMVYTIWVNRSSDGANLLTGTLNVQFFQFNIWWDRSCYLPGEQLVGDYIAWTIPMNTPVVGLTVEFSMQYWDMIDGTVKWSNVTLTVAPFTVTLPADADINADIQVTITAVATLGNITVVYWIDLGAIAGDVATDKTNYRADEPIVATMIATAVGGSTSSLPGAAVTVKLDDGTGTYIVGVNITGLTTSSSGSVRTVINLPAGIQPGWYRVIATFEKAGMKVTASEWIQVVQAWSIQVNVNKQAYVGGESIQVDVELVVNGVATTGDSVYYWLNLNTAAVLAVSGMTSFMNFTVTAPSGVDDTALIWVNVIVGEDVYVGVSANFRIAPQMMTVSASQIDYMAGDDITFEVLMVGTTTGFTLKYMILDNLGQSVANGTLTLDANGKATFRLQVPDDKVPTWYQAKVVADNGNGRVLAQTVQVNLMDVYFVKYQILTGPAYQTGQYAAGQEITIGFEIIAQVEMPDKATVTASVRDHTNGWDGETKTFTAMKGELKIVLPENAMVGPHVIRLTILDLHSIGDVDIYDQTITVGSQGVFNSDIAGMSLAELFILMLVVITMLLVVFMLMKGGGAGAAAMAGAAPAAPAPKKEETYQPKSSVKCPACGAMIDVATSKRPIEVMCPKCGTSQIVN